MTDLINVFNKLTEFYDRTLLWEQVEEIYERSVETAPQSKNKCNSKTVPINDRGDDRSDNEPLGGLGSTCESIRNLSVVHRALNDPQVLPTLLELCTTIRSIRESGVSYDNTYDCWDQVVKVSPRDSYLAFIYALAGLSNLDAANAQYTKLALAAASTYLLSLTIPGAKGFHVFEEYIIAHVLQVFKLIEKLQNTQVLKRMSRQRPIEIWVNIATLCDDIKLLLRYVHFNDQKTALDHILRKLIDILFLNHEHGYANIYASNLHNKCFEIFEEMINAHNGEPEETLKKLLSKTIFLHAYAPKPKAPPGNNDYVTSVSRCDHISDWFIQCIAKYPRLLAKVLSFYIESMVTNQLKQWKTEQILRALDYAAKYDAALFTKCNVSCVEFLCEAVYSEEGMARSRAIDLMARILLIESEVDWQVFRHEVSDIPRELYLIKELIESLKDSNNTVKLKAVQALQLALTRGSPNAQKILSEGLKFAHFNDPNVMLPEEPRIHKNEIRYAKPLVWTPAYSFEGRGLIELSFLNLPQLIYTQLFRNSLSYIRRAGIMFMEHIAKLNPLIIFNTNFVAETCRLVGEPTALVRKHTLNMVDSVLSCYPNCYPVIWVWCNIIARMLRDSDPKNIELAMECFRSKVLLNMKGIDQSNQAEHFMPWVIIRTMLSTESRLYLQTCFHLALQQRMINSEIVSTIESHLVTTNSTEAWVVLNFISAKMKSKEPDSLIHLFTSLESWNQESNTLIALEVLGNYVQDFSHSALNFAFNHILSRMRDGSMLYTVISKAFDFLMLIDHISQKQRATMTSTTSEGDNHSDSLIIDKEWLVDLHNFVEIRILSGIQDFPDNRATFMSYLHSYSEAILQMRLPANSTIISFVHKYIGECLKLPESELDMENERLFNSILLITGRFSLRNACVASTTCRLYGIVLKNIDRPPIVNTIIVAVTDLCKKHTQIVERIIDNMLHKLESPYTVNRLETFKCFERLVLQDQLKLRGTLLLALMAALLDGSQEVAMRARNFFSQFLSKKNPMLFQKCLIECPFVLNEYKNFEGLDSFSEANTRSPLSGEINRKSRQKLYNYLMSTMDEINLVLYFGQLKLIADKSRHDPLIKSPEGVALLKDILYILRRVCQLSKEQKCTSENKDPSETNIDDMEGADISTAVDKPQISSSAVATQAAVSSAAGSGGRGRRRREVATMSDALSLLEKSLAFIPIIYHNTKELDSTIEKSFDDLGNALAKHFPSLIDYAQPAEFWNKYRQSKAAQPRRNKGTKKRRSNQSNDDSVELDGQDLEEEMLIDSGHDSDDASEVEASNFKRKKYAVNSSELLMEYLFNPSINNLVVF